MFEYEGKLYETEYSQGLTEYQEESPWENESKVECVEVEEYKKTIVDYKPVSNSDNHEEFT